MKHELLPLLIGVDYQQKSESKWLRPIGIPTGATAGKNHVGFTNITVNLLSEMHFHSFSFMENLHSVEQGFTPSLCAFHAAYSLK